METETFLQVGVVSDYDLLALDSISGTPFSFKTKVNFLKIRTLQVTLRGKLFLDPCLVQ